MGETTAVRFGVLGPLEVLAGERDIAIPAGQMRTLLAALLVAAGRPVRADELAERLWPGRMPVSARGAVQTYIARLRVLLGHELIRTTPDGGYLVTADAEHVDLWRFRDLLDTARRSESAESELATLRAALGLWRSRPFLGVDSAWLDHQVIPTLVEERFAAIERRIDLELRAAEAAGEAVGEAFVLDSLGCIYLDSADGRQAAEHVQESLVRFRRVGHLRGEAMVLGNHGRTQAIMGNFARAERDVMRALHQYSVLGSRHGIAQNLDNLAASFAGAGNHRHAISAYLRADAIARELADTHMSAVIRHQVGNAYLALGEIRHAITAFRRAIAGSGSWASGGGRRSSWSTWARRCARPATRASRGRSWRPPCGH